MNDKDLNELGLDSDSYYQIVIRRFIRLEESPIKFDVISLCEKKRYIEAYKLIMREKHENFWRKQK